MRFASIFLIITVIQIFQPAICQENIRYKVTTNTNSLNIREKPNVTATVIGGIPKDQIVVAQELNGNWVKIIPQDDWLKSNHKGKQGWVSKNFLMEMPNHSDTQQPTQDIPKRNSDSLNLHKMLNQKKELSIKIKKAKAEQCSVDSLNSKGKFKLSIYGTGNSQEAISGEEGAFLNGGGGVSLVKEFSESQGYTFWGMYRINLDASIQIATNSDTLFVDGYDQTHGRRIALNSREFGSYILTPLNSKPGVNIDLMGYNLHTYLCIISGFRFQYISSSRNWALNKDSVYQVSGHRLRLGTFHDFVPYQHRENYSVRLGLSLAYNGIGGDLGLNRHRDIRRYFLGTVKKHYFGIEGTLSMRANKVKLEFAYSYLPTKPRKEVAGLSGGRMSLYFEFMGGIDVVDR